MQLQWIKLIINPTNDLRQIEEDFVANSSESDDESIRAEQEKVQKLILKP